MHLIISDEHNGIINYTLSISCPICQLYRIPFYIAEIEPAKTHPPIRVGMLVNYDPGNTLVITIDLILCHICENQRLMNRQEDIEIVVADCR